jgi:hypothetical protein
MPARGVRFRAIHVSGFEDAFVTGDAVLLIELRALGKVRNPVKVTNCKQICSTFRAPGDDFRCDDFREMAACQKLSEVSEHRCLYPEDVSNPVVA